MPGFQCVVSEAWTEISCHVEPYQWLFHKLKRRCQKLRSWSKTLFSNSKVQLHMALEVILRLDLAQEQRELSLEERDFQKRLKRRIISLAVLEKSRKRQNSRITNLKEGDANTRYFHLRVNHRRRKNFIHRLKHNQGWVTSHEDKEKIVHSHFKNIAKKGPTRNIDVNWGLLPTPNCNLQGLWHSLRRRSKKPCSVWKAIELLAPTIYPQSFINTAGTLLKMILCIYLKHFIVIP